MVEVDQFSGTEPLLELSNTMAYAGEEELGNGLLRIRENALTWRNYSGSKELHLNFPYIAVHAVSRDTSVFPFRPCILLLYSISDEEESEELTNYRLCTQEPEQLDEMFEVISNCQKLYPDSELSSDSAEEDETIPQEDFTGDDVTEGYFTTADGLQQLSIDGESVLSHLENILQNPSQVHTGQHLTSSTEDQFKDADTT